jgi:hypothetical protein
MEKLSRPDFFGTRDHRHRCHFPAGQHGQAGFRGGKASAILGGLEIDLTQAKLKDNQATIELSAILGGIDVFVPREWKVIVDSSAILGGVDDKHRPASADTDQPTLYVKATAILGGIDIKN